MRISREIWRRVGMRFIQWLQEPFFANKPNDQTIGQFVRREVRCIENQRRGAKFVRATRSRK